MKKKRYLVIFLCLMLILCLASCGKKTEPVNADGETTAESMQSEQTTTAETQKETKKKETKVTKETKKKESSAKQSASQKKETSSAKTNKKPSKETKAKKPSGHVLTVKKGNQKVYFTESQLAGMGKSTYKYSFRNKDSSHRQFMNCTGVRLTKVLEKSGFSGSKVRLRSKDGYTREFSISELKASKKAFLKKSGSSAKSVPSIITVKGSEAFRLCFGQAADDSDDNGDYNAQYWVKWIDTIEVY